MKKRNNVLTFTKILATLIVFSLVVSLIPGFTVSAEGNRGRESYNAHNHNYRYGTWYSQWNWAEVPNSYMYLSAEGPVRVEALNDESKLLIEKYSKTLTLLSSTTLDFELPIFGGFYCGKDALYVMYGQKNESESDDCEVVRVVKYDTSWNRIKSVSFKGINTYIPFDAGSSDFTEYGNMLYIRTCHEMYANEDGLHHQANMTFTINTDSMTEVSSYTRVMNYTCGYVSHSFNQFIRIDGDKIVAVDHGDAHPRGILLGTYSATDAAEGRLDIYGGYTSVNMLTIPGNSGANFTGTSVGGFEISSKNYLVAASRVEYDDNFNSNAVRNAVLLVQPRGDFSSTTKEIKFTSYAEGAGQGCGNPYLVKVSDDCFVLMWELLDTSSNSKNSANYTGKFQAVVIDGNGNILSEIKTIEGELSDCKPIAANNKVIWYVTGETQVNQWGYSNVSPSAPYYYVMDLESYSLNTQKIDPAVGTNEDINGSNNSGNNNQQNNNQQNNNKESNDITDEQREQIEAFVKRFYKEILGREAEEDGIKYWSDILANKEQTGAQVASGFIHSPEFMEAHYSDDIVVAKMYDAFFDRKPGPEEYQYWMDKFIDGFTLEQVLSGFTDSGEFQALCDKYGIERGSLGYDQSNPQGQPRQLKFGSRDNLDDAKLTEYVTRMYTKALDRKEVSQAEIDYWKSTIIAGQDASGKKYDPASVASDGFLNSNEYIGRNRTDEEFVYDCYQAFFDRTPGQIESDYWLDRMHNKGYSRKRVVLEGFGVSGEFQNLLKTYGFEILE